jgi:hypothetical protein
MSLTQFKARLAQAAAILTSNGENDAKPVTNEFRETVLAGYNWLARYLNISEVNPITYQYTPAQTFVSASNFAAAQTLYYPSSAGITVGSQVDMCTQLYLSSSSGSIFCYFEGTNDTSASPKWVDMTYAGHAINTNIGGMSGSSYASFSCATGTADFLIEYRCMNVEKWRIRTVIDYSGINTLSIYPRRKAI